MARGTTTFRTSGRELNRRVTLMVPGANVPQTINGVPVPGSNAARTFTEVQVFAKRMESAGSEGTDDEVLSDTQTCRWMIAFRPDVNTDFGIVDELGTFWDIRGVSEFGKRSFLMLNCAARKAS